MSDNKHTSTGPKKSDVAQKASEQRGRLFDPTGKVEYLMDDEVMIADVRRHPFGLFLLYLQISVALALSLGLTLFFLPSLSGAIDVSDAALVNFATALSLIVGVFGVLYVILVTRIYNGNQLIISDKNITQVLQVGLFDRKVSELSMGNVEDVTARQSGIFPTMLNYGILIVETAGEQNNFTFKYCPNPNAYAKAISDCRIEYAQKSKSH